MNRVCLSIICGCALLSISYVSPPIGRAVPAGQNNDVTGSAVSAHVKRAVFTSGVEEREPLDQLDKLSTESIEVFFFTEIVDLSGHAVTHRWVYEGETMAEVVFAIGGPRWRVYSSKKLIPEWVGTWSVEVVDEQGTVLREAKLEYVSPPSP